MSTMSNTIIDVGGFSWLSAATRVHIGTQCTRRRQAVITQSGIGHYSDSCASARVGYIARCETQEAEADLRPRLGGRLGGPGLPAVQPELLRHGDRVDAQR